MEEEEFTKTAYGFHSKIQSPTTIIASANPVNNSKWKDSNKIDLNEFPVLAPLLDRFDLKFAFKEKKDPKEIRAFGKKYSKTLAKKAKGQLPDYTPFLIKYIEYARQLKPIINEEATIMLEEFYINVKIKGFGSDRVLPTLHKLTKAVARLKLKEIVDEEDAKEVMEFYNVMLVDFQKSVVVSQSPRDLAYNECVSILEQIKGFGGITLEELFKKVCENNEQLANYFEYNDKPLKIKNNRKVRDVYERLLNHSNIKKVQEKPIVLQWLDPLSTTIEGPDLSDPSDVCDKDKTTVHNNKEKEKNIEEKINKSGLEQLSHRSHRSPKVQEEQVTDESNNDKISLLKTNSNLRSNSIEMTKEQYDSWTENENSKSVK
jgi:DNA replicative helicase MCM subunit Mcm2 (Cdc46/Mcm family)